MEPRGQMSEMVGALARLWSLKESWDGKKSAEEPFPDGFAARGQQDRIEYLCARSLRAIESHRKAAFADEAADAIGQVLAVAQRLGLLSPPDAGRSDGRGDGRRVVFGDPGVSYSTPPPAPAVR